MFLNSCDERVHRSRIIRAARYGRSGKSEKKCRVTCDLKRSLDRKLPWPKGEGTLRDGSGSTDMQMKKKLESN